jgi:poly(hydroxyalkanoate) granule-associated protein
MAIKRTKQAPAAQIPTDKARALWLAGLGAVSIAQKRGGELVSGLIAEGHDFQTRANKLAQKLTSNAREQANSALAPFRAGFKRNVRKLGTALQDGMAGVLARLGIPSKNDIEALTQRVTALSKQLKTAK